MMTLNNLTESNLLEGTQLPEDLRVVLEAVDEDLILEAILGDLYSVHELSEDSVSINPDLQGLVESNLLSERTIIRMDKVAKKNRMYKLALYSILKKRNPKLFNKLKFVIKMKKSIIALSAKKYGDQAKILGNAMFRKAASKPKINHVLKNKGKTLTIKPKPQMVNAGQIDKMLNKVKM
ncbi:MAG: hypothetical protein ACRC0G_07805 [Fusobacteriaceae bacterium]